MIDSLTQELRGFEDEESMRHGPWPIGQKLSVLIRSCEMAGDVSLAH